MRTVHGIEPKDPYKVWDFKTLGRKDDAAVQARNQLSFPLNSYVSKSAKDSKGEVHYSLCLLVVLLHQARPLCRAKHPDKLNMVVPGEWPAWSSPEPCLATGREADSHTE